jgi:hypothetical protein
MKLDVFNKVMHVHRLLGLPAMTPREREIYKDILQSLSAGGKKLDIFEYGSGFSTVYFAKFMTSKGINFDLNSVDNHAGWHEEVKRMIASEGLTQKVHLHLCHFEPFWEKPGWEWNKTPAPGAFAPKLAVEEEYIQKPVALKKKFDVIVVDGRFRRRCLQLAKEALKDNGIVFLHDAQNEKYHGPLSDFAQGQFIDGGNYYPLERRTHTVWMSRQINKGKL